jgi:hypothetical protein
MSTTPKVKKALIVAVGVAAAAALMAEAPHVLPLTNSDNGTHVLALHPQPLPPRKHI